MKRKQFVKLRAFAKELRKTYSVKDLVAEVHNLFQDYIINHRQEEELYNIVDPLDEEDSPAELWYSDNYGCVELYNFALNIA